MLARDRSRGKDRGATRTEVAASRHAPDGLTLDARDDESFRACVEMLLARHWRIDGLVVAAAPSARSLDSARNSDPAQVVDAVDAKATTFSAWPMRSCPQ
jgi:NAD(P)-dependent dehydrogenase (short-subunit alcohol dehydrogenase family)